MKVAIISDTHGGVRSDSLIFDGESEQFFKTVFFPYIDKHKITSVIHLGDVFDRRKYINFQILKNVKRYFFDEMDKRDMKMIIIPGNHDTYYKNTNEVNSLDLLLSEYRDKVTVFNIAEDICVDGLYISVIPWICDENRTEVMKFLNDTYSKICFGHLEIEGFEMYKGMGSHVGESPEIFDKFDLVVSGHYHHKSTVGQINYLGCPYEMTWSDFDDPKGFHVFDTDTAELTFIRNPKELHKKVFYDDRVDTPDPKKYKGHIIKLIVIHKDDFVKFDKFVDTLYKEGVFDVKIMEDFGESESEINETVNVEDTSTLLSEYVDGMELDIDKAKLKTVLSGLYIEALHTEV